MKAFCCTTKDSGVILWYFTNFIHNFDAAVTTSGWCEGNSASRSKGFVSSLDIPVAEHKVVIHCTTVCADKSRVLESCFVSFSVLVCKIGFLKQRSVLL